MGIKILLHCPEDMELIKEYCVPLSVQSFPCILRIPDFVDVEEPPFSPEVYDPSDMDAYEDGYPVLDVRDTYIVCLETYADSLALFDNTESWSSETFQKPREFLERPFFIVSGGLRCRWYSSLSEAQRAVPFAKPCKIEDLSFGGFLDIPLENII